MAQKRMFSKKVTDSDKFLDLPLTAQALYFHLNMHGDDDGFVDNTKTVKRMLGASDGDLRMLIEQNFLIPFESGVVVIKDWRVHNTIKNDRYQKTIYTDEFKRLSIAENKSYTEWFQNGSNMEPQIRLDKDSIGKDRLDEDRGGYTPPPPKSNLNFGQFVRAEGLKVNDNHIQRLLDYIGLDGMDMDLVKLAVSRTTEQGIVAPAYTFSILDNWKKKGFTTVEQANQEQEEFEQHKSRSITPPQKSNVPEWSNPDYKAPTLDELKVELTEDYSDDPTAF